MEDINNNTYLINLKRRYDRLTRSSEILNSYNFNFFKRFEAVDGSKIDDNKLKEILSKDAYNKLYFKTRETHEQLTIGGVGCALSHIELWKQLVNSPYDKMLIFEDDIDINWDLYYTIEYIFNKFKKDNIDFDIFLFSVNCPFGNECFQKVNYPLKLFNYKLYKVFYFWSTACYIITKKAAKKLLKNVFPLKKQIDQYMADYCNELKIYTIKPYIVTQSILTKTDIQNNCKECNTKLMFYKNGKLIKWNSFQALKSIIDYNPQLLFLISILITIIIILIVITK